MEQMNIDESLRVPVNYEDQNTPKAVRELKPVVFRDGNNYCCLLGPDPKRGIFGCNETIDGAISQWLTNLKNRISSPDEDDDVARYVIDMFNTSVDDVW